MKIAVLSGKGGTGKTTVSASLASALNKCQYIDCDVEEPNGAIFMKPQIAGSEDVTVMTPVIDEALCVGCGACAKACRFHALALAGKKVLVFSELCHSCGACMIACRQNAISESSRSIGVVASDAEGLFLQGRLNVGESIAVPIIRKLKQMLRCDIPVVLDSPPGASCTVVNTIEDCDYCLLVTEPTPFGLHDLQIAVQLVRSMGIDFGVVINKAAENDSTIHEHCTANNIPVLMETPFSKSIAERYSRGLLPVHNDRVWQMKFMNLYEQIARRCRK